MVAALTFPRLYQGFELSRQADGCRDTTISMYRLAYRSVLANLPLEAVSDARNITPDHLLTWAAAIRPLATATRDQRIAKIKALFRWAHQNSYLPSDPSVVLHRPRKDWQPDPLSIDDVERLLDVSGRGRNGIRNRAIVSLLLDSGIRSGELCGLKRADLVLKSGQLTVLGKGGKTRTVMVGKRTRDAMWRYLATRDPDDPSWLFVTENNRAFQKDTLYRLIANLGTEAGIPRLFPHRCRHTFALMFLRGRGDPYTLQYMLGHEDMSVTRMYVKLAAQDVRETYRSPLDALSTQ